ncbi:phage integrase SAM-like domain-containing protein [Pedobacter sp. UYP1]|uniref:phage integrase SAM-like domain-containing protein n=1 Tax=Pedobacter sp. UYP1 TaxID=1756396 RepID=UPI003395912D
MLEPGTLKNYYSTERYLQEFLVKKRKMKDIYLDNVDNKFITDFGVYMLGYIAPLGGPICAEYP